MIHSSLIIFYIADMSQLRALQWAVYVKLIMQKDSN